ncbi:recombinase family protein [Rhodococcus sp. 1139]|uniref:recombinase family protein n=1 Tax=Rhodococcus sp. 1139 TaxID=1833762 RepID=UPI0009F3FE13|nr:recombinase family protein [Rhodococcus sp. 1139]
MTSNIQSLSGLRVVGYARVSTQAQGEKGYGLAAQQDVMRQYCAANGLQLLTITYDVVSGGSVEKMHGRATAIAAIESGLADALLVRALDRATRDQLDAASIFKRANKNGWRLLDCDRADSGDPSQRLLADIRIAMAAEEKRKISERTREGMRRAKAQGKHIGRPSRIDPVVVEGIVEMRQEGLSAKAIAEVLDGTDIRPPGGGRGWSDSTIRRVLAREGVA